MVLRTVRVLAISAAAMTLSIAPVVRAAEPAAGGATHVVEAGGTLSQIALDAGTDGATLAQLNGLDVDGVLSLGQALKLPGAGSAVAAPGAAAASPPAGAPAGVATAAVAAAPASVAPASAAPASAAGGQYTVAEGDTL